MADPRTKLDELEDRLRYLERRAEESIGNEAEATRRVAYAILALATTLQLDQLKREMRKY